MVAGKVRCQPFLKLSELGEQSLQALLQASR